MGSKGLVLKERVPVTGQSAQCEAAEYLKMTFCSKEPPDMLCRVARYVRAGGMDTANTPVVWATLQVPQSWCFWWSCFAMVRASKIHIQLKSCWALSFHHV